MGLTLDQLEKMATHHPTTTTPPPKLQHPSQTTHSGGTQPHEGIALAQNGQITSKIWPQANIIALQQSVHGLFHQRHVTGVIDTEEKTEEHRMISGFPEPGCTFLAAAACRAIQSKASLTSVRTPRLLLKGTTKSHSNPFSGLSASL